MAFTIETFRNDLTPMIDGLTSGGILLDIVVIPALTTGSKAYPRVGQTADLTWRIVKGGGPTISVSMTGGTVTLNWAYSVGTPQYETTVFVFASNLISNEQFVIQLINDAGETLADQGFPSPQYVGQMPLGAAPAASYTTPGGYTAIVHATSVTDLRAGANKMVTMNMPDVGTDDTWYALRKEYILASEGAVAVSVVIFTKAATYKLPSVHVYALDAPVATADQFSLRVEDANLNLTFDSSAECLPGRAALNIDYPVYGSATNSYMLSFVGVPALCLPFYQYGAQSTADSSRTNRYTGAAKRVGSQVTCVTLFDFVTSLESSQAGGQYQAGNRSGRYCAAADIKYLSPSETVLATPGATGSAPILSVLQDQYAPPNQSLTLSVTATGGPAPSLQWYRQGVAIAGATSANYTFTPTQADDGAAYWCVATNVIASVSTRKAQYFIDTSTAPVITNVSYPTGYVNPGDPITVSFTASGSPTPTCRIYWGDLFSTDLRATGYAGSVAYSFTAPAGQTSVQLYLTAQTDGEHRSQLVTRSITINEASPNAVAIVSSPANSTVQSGDTVSFTVSVSGDAPFYYSWLKNGSAIGPPNLQSNATSNTLSFVTSDSDNGARIECVVGNHMQPNDTLTYTATSTAAILTVIAATPTAPTPVFSTSPSTRSVTAGSSASFSCAASNYTSLQWYKDGSPIEGATGTSCTVFTSTSDSGSSFTINVLATNAPSGYNASSAWSSDATLSVTSAPVQTTYTSYKDFTGYVDEYSNSADFAVYRGGYTDSTDWANGTGDGTLYDVMATSSSYNNQNTTGYFGVSVWYSFATYDGVQWGVNPSGATGHVSSVELSIQIRLRSTGQIVSTGSVTLRTQNGGVQA